MKCGCSVLVIAWILWSHGCLKSGNPVYVSLALFDDEEQCDTAAAARVRDVQRRYPRGMHVEQGVMSTTWRQLFFCAREKSDPGRLVPECGSP